MHYISKLSTRKLIIPKNKSSKNFFSNLLLLLWKRNEKDEGDDRNKKN